MSRFVFSAGAEPPPAVRDYLDRADVAELPGTPTAHQRWTDASGKISAAHWSTAGATGGIEHSGSFTAWAGNLRIAGRPGYVTATDLEAAIAASPSHPQVAFRDAYAVAHLHADGSGLAFSDELGMHPLFLAEPVDGVLVVGNRADLVAAVDARWRGTTPTRSVESAKWLAYAGYVLERSTGFDGIRQIGHGDVIQISAGRASITKGVPLHSGAEADRLDVATFTDALEQEIVEALQHALEIAARPELDLTGGKDSRLIFAVAHRAGLLADFAPTTYGPPDLVDVLIAAELCELVGARHHNIKSRKPANAPTLSSMDRARRHIHRTGGLSSLGEAIEPTINGPVFVSGIAGENFRTDHPGEARNPAASATEAAERFTVQRRMGSSGLLFPNVIETLDIQSREIAMAAANVVRDPGDLRAAFTSQSRFPAWQSPIIDRNEQRIAPFMSGSLVRDSYRLTPIERGLELPHRILIERADVRLARHPFANSSWRKPKPTPKPKPVRVAAPRPAPLPQPLRLLRRAVPEIVRAPIRPARSLIQKRRTPPPAPQPAPPEPSISDIEPTAAVDGLSSVRKTRDWLPVSRRDLLALLESDRENPLFDFVDFDRLREYVAGGESDDPLVHMQVNGALAAFMWLGAHDQPSRPDG